MEQMSNGACGAPLTIGGIAQLVCFIVFGFAKTFFLIIRVDVDDNWMCVWIELHKFLNWDFSFSIKTFFLLRSHINNGCIVNFLIIDLVETSKLEFIVLMN